MFTRIPVLAVFQSMHGELVPASEVMTRGWLVGLL